MILPETGHSLPASGFLSSPPTPDNRVCRVCKASYRFGRWSWDEAPSTSESAICPACRRIHCDDPAGLVDLHGDILTRRPEEISRLIRATERSVREKHALERIMGVTEPNGVWRILTTGVYLAKRIGEALQAEMEGHMSEDYAYGTKTIRVRWHHDHIH